MAVSDGVCRGSWLPPADYNEPNKVWEKGESMINPPLACYGGDR